MKIDTLKTGVAIAETVIGLIFTTVGIYYLVEVSRCDPGAILCGLGLIPVALFLLPGCVTLAVGTFLCFSNGLKYRQVQMSLAVVVFIYYASLVAMWMLLVA